MTMRCVVVVSGFVRDAAGPNADPSWWPNLCPGASSSSELLVVISHRLFSSSFIGIQTYQGAVPQTVVPGQSAALLGAQSYAHAHADPSRTATPPLPMAAHMASSGLPSFLAGPAPPALPPSTSLFAPSSNIAPSSAAQPLAASMGALPQGHGAAEAVNDWATLPMATDVAGSPKRAKMAG